MKGENVYMKHMLNFENEMIAGFQGHCINILYTILFSFWGIKFNQRAPVYSGQYV